MLRTTPRGAMIATFAHRKFGRGTVAGAARIMLAAVSIVIGIRAVEPGRAASAQIPSVDGLQRITEFFDNEIAGGKLPGAVVLIQQHGKPVYLKCFGVRDVATNLPMTPDTIFEIGRASCRERV